MEQTRRVNVGDQYNRSSIKGVKPLNRGEGSTSPTRNSSKEKKMMIEQSVIRLANSPKKATVTIGGQSSYTTSAKKSSIISPSKTIGSTSTIRR